MTLQLNNRALLPTILAAALLLYACAAPKPVTIQKAPPTSLDAHRKYIKENAKPKEKAKLPEYTPSEQCNECHQNIYKQFSGSMHARSFENPVFQAQYFKEVVPLANMEMSIIMQAKDKVLSLIKQKEKDENRIIDESRGCIACHSPVTFVRGRERLIVSKSQVNPKLSGVVCDFCHTIKDFKGKVPGDANYVIAPGQQKLGPFDFKTNWHHAYSKLQTESKFCAICHNRTNRNNLEIMATYTEWKNSSYFKKGIECQDCHMNVNGFLTAGKAEFESGKAAEMLAGNIPVLTAYREKLYSHSFPGAHSESQVKDALTLDIKIKESAVSPGDVLTIDVLVDNSRTGHKMPSGSAELRLLWLEVTASTGEKLTHISPMTAAEDEGYSIAGRGKMDRDMFGDEIAEGSRMYRSVLFDKKGKQTLKSYDAAEIVFDNRLNSSEVRSERYRFKVPALAKDDLDFTARLYYLSYPSLFAKELDIPEAKPKEIAFKEVTVPVK